MGPFGSHAIDLFERGLAVLPISPKTGKPPIEGFHKNLLGPRALCTLADRFSDYNIGILPAFSNLVVVDADSPGVVDVARERFGETPLEVATGTEGNRQLYYKGSHRLLSSNLRAAKDPLPIEIKSTGTLVVAPPSVSYKTGREYTFARGDWSDLPNLPAIKLDPELKWVRRRGRHQQLSQAVPEGQRHAFLFRWALHEVRGVSSIEELIDILNEALDDYCEIGGHPVTDAEVAKIANGAWEYEQKGRNFCGTPQPICPVTEPEIAYLNARYGRDGSHAFTLYLFLKLMHTVRPGPFKLDTQAMAEAIEVLRWSRAEYRTTIDQLLDARLLVCVHQGAGRGDPSLYVLRPVPEGFAYRSSLEKQRNDYPQTRGGAVSDYIVAENVHPSHQPSHALDEAEVTPDELRRMAEKHCQSVRTTQRQLDAAGIPRQRRTKQINPFGQSVSITEAAEVAGVSRTAMSYRLNGRELKDGTRTKPLTPDAAVLMPRHDGVRTHDLSELGIDPEAFREALADGLRASAQPLLDEVGDDATAADLWAAQEAQRAGKSKS